jgi:hypothetical protein
MFSADSQPHQEYAMFRTTPRQSIALLLGTGLLLSACDRPDVPAAQPQADAPSDASGAPAVAPASIPTTTSGAAVFAAADLTVPLAPMASCNFEQIDGQPFADAPLQVQKDADFVVTGFAYDATREVVPSDLRLRAIGPDGAAWEAPVRGRLDRPDVTTYFKLGDWARASGFEQLVSGKGIAPGEYRMVLVFAADGKQFSCDNGRRVVVGA